MRNTKKLRQMHEVMEVVDEILDRADRAGCYEHLESGEGDINSLEDIKSELRWAFDKMNYLNLVSLQLLLDGAVCSEEKLKLAYSGVRKKRDSI